MDLPNRSRPSFRRRPSHGRVTGRGAPARRSQVSDAGGFPPRHPGPRADGARHSESNPSPRGIKPGPTRYGSRCAVRASAANRLGRAPSEPSRRRAAPGQRHRPWGPAPRAVECRLAQRGFKWTPSRQSRSSRRGSARAPVTEPIRSERRPLRDHLVRVRRLDGSDGLDSDGLDSDGLDSTASREPPPLTRAPASAAIRLGFRPQHTPAGVR